MVTTRRQRETRDAVEAALSGKGPGAGELVFKFFLLAMLLISLFILGVYIAGRSIL